MFKKVVLTLLASLSGPIVVVISNPIVNWTATGGLLTAVICSFIAAKGVWTKPQKRYPIDAQAIRQTRIYLDKNFGSILGLPPELRDTITNIYYHLYVILGDQIEFVFSEGVDKIPNKLTETHVYLEHAKVLPEMVNLLLNDFIPKNKKKDVKYVTTVLLCIFKYRIKNVMSTPMYILKIKMFFARKNVSEIPNLYEKMFNFSIENEQS